MSAPPSGSSGSPVPGYYPDPSIPNYIRYWNGSAWVPGTSRPAPIGPDAPVPAAVDGPAAQTAQAAPPPGVDESGPMFLDEDPGAPRAQPGPAAAPAAWPDVTPPGAQAPRISWGSPAAAAEPHRPAAAAEPHRPHAADPQPGVQSRPGIPGQNAGAPGAAAGQGGRPRQPAAQVAGQAVAGDWAAQVRELARGEGGPAGIGPAGALRPVAADPFAAARGNDRPGGLARRFAARVVDAVLLLAVTAAAAVPLGAAAYHHARDKVDHARMTGETVKVWLLDGTTGAELGAAVAVLLVAGLLLEVLPTAKWGRTPGKKLVGLRVLDIEGQLPPGFGASLRRWLTHTLLDLTVVGVLGTAWCAVDRPWKQGLHDKAARTFVAGT